MIQEDIIQLIVFSMSILQGVNMLVKIEHDENGEACFTIPEEIIKKFDLHPGDEVHFVERDDGSLEMTFPKNAPIV